jgi:hypothetical protein
VVFDVAVQLLIDKVPVCVNPHHEWDADIDVGEMTVAEPPPVKLYLT